MYRERDTKLHRDVALKILPEASATDRERLARFEREARVAGARVTQSSAHRRDLRTRGRGDRAYVDLIAFLLNANGGRTGALELPLDVAELEMIVITAEQR